MATLAAGSSVTVALIAGNTLHIAGFAEVNIRPGLTEQVSSIGAFGPYDTNSTINIKAVSGSVIYWATEGDSEDHVELSPPNAITAFPLNSYGIQSAIDAISSSGQAGRVILLPTTYDIDAQINLKPGVSIVGELGKYDFSGYVPDADPAIVNGSILSVRSGVTAIAYNNVDQPNPVPAQLADTACSGGILSGFSIVGGLRGIHTGAKNILGLFDFLVERIRFFNQEEEHYIFENFMHCHFRDLLCWNDLPGVVAGGMVFRNSRLRDGSSVMALLPGNSVWSGTIFGWTNQFLGRGLFVQGLDGQLNECSFSAARVQFNRHAALTVAQDVVMTMTSGSANFVVADNAQFALCQVGMPLAIAATGTSVGAVSAGVVYFVSSRDAGTNTITLNEFPNKTTSNLTASSTGSATVKCGGFAGVSVVGDDTGSVTAFDLGRLDIECKGAVATIVLRNVKGSGHILEIMNSDTDTAIVPRNCDFGISYIGNANITTDSSTNHGFFRTENLAGGAVQYSGGSFTLTSGYNNQIMRYSGASDINITVPRTLPKGFKFKAVCTSTGQITAVAGTGTLFQNRSASAKTAGGTAPQLNLDFLSASSGGTTFHLWGDLGG